MIGGHALFTTLMLMEWWVKRPKDLLKKDSLYMSKKQLADFILAIRATLSFFSSFFMALWACPHSY